MRFDGRNGHEETVQGVQHPRRGKVSESSGKDEPQPHARDRQQARLQTEQEYRAISRDPECAEDAYFAPPLNDGDADGVVNEKRPHEQRDVPGQLQCRAKGQGECAKARPEPVRLLDGESTADLLLDAIRECPEIGTGIGRDVDAVHERAPRERLLRGVYEHDGNLSSERRCRPRVFENAAHVKLLGSVGREQAKPAALGETVPRGKPRRHEQRGRIVDEGERVFDRSGVALLDVERQEVEVPEEVDPENQEGLAEVGGLGGHLEAGGRVGDAGHVRNRGDQIRRNPDARALNRQIGATGDSCDDLRERGHHALRRRFGGHEQGDAETDTDDDEYGAQGRPRPVTKADLTK